MCCRNSTISSGGQTSVSHSSTAFRMADGSWAIEADQPSPSRRSGLRRGKGFEMTGRIVFYAIRPHEELRVRHELLHRPDVHLARTEARGTDGIFYMLTVCKVLGLEI